MTGTRTYEAVDATFVLLVNDAQYRYLADKDGKPFSYFLNPAAYGGGVAKVRWDETNKKWMFENGSDTNDSGDTPPASFSPLDDRYTVGAGYGANNIPYGKNATEVDSVQGYKAPLGAALPASEITFDASGNLVLPGFDAVSLSPVFESAEIKPVLILKVYDTRLASYDYYAYLGEFEEDAEGDSEFFNAEYMFEAYTELVNTKADFIVALARQWVKRLTNWYDSEDLNGHLNYNLENFYGESVFNKWKDLVLPTFGISPLGNTADRVALSIYLPSFSYYDGHKIRGEKVDEVSSGHLGKPAIEMPGLTKVVGHEYFGLKSMRGVYTIFPRPEQLSYLAKIVEDTVDSVVDAITSPIDAAVVKPIIKEKLGVHWYDYFRGSESKVVIPVAWDENPESPTYKEATEWKEVTVNVFMGINTQGNLAGTVSYYYYDAEDEEYKRTSAAGMGVNLGDVFSYYTGAQDKSQPFPTAYGYVTGPYGSQVLVDNETGKKVGYKSDAYTV